MTILSDLREFCGENFPNIERNRDLAAIINILRQSRNEEIAARNFTEMSVYSGTEDRTRGLTSEELINITDQQFIDLALLIENGEALDDVGGVLEDSIAASAVEVDFIYGNSLFAAIDDLLTYGIMGFDNSGEETRSVDSDGNGTPSSSASDGTTTRLSGSRSRPSSR